MLIPTFKSMGAIRCFYVAMVAEEILDRNQDISEYNPGSTHWVLYPALIEFLYEYFHYLDYQLNLILDQNKFQKEHILLKDFGCNANPRDSYFKEYLPKIEYSRRFKVLQSQGDFYCLFSDKKHIETIQDRIRVKSRTTIIPDA